MKFLSTLLLFSLLCFACGEQTATTEEMPETPAMTETAPPPPPAMPQADPLLAGTIDAVQSAGGDLTALSPQAAVSNIESWINKLSSMDGTAPIVTDLKALQAELQTGNINGSKVSGLLSSLATKTRSLSSNAPMLNTLAGALQAGADKLAGK